MSNTFRKQLAEEFKCDVTEYKKFIDKKLMQLLDELPTKTGTTSFKFFLEQEI